MDALDAFGSTVGPAGQSFDLMVNFDPETVILNGEADLANPPSNKKDYRISWDDGEYTGSGGMGKEPLLILC